MERNVDRNDRACDAASGGSALLEYFGRVGLVRFNQVNRHYTHFAE
jgi:hypothetical protein